jgi:hypothetical protein
MKLRISPVATVLGLAAALTGYAATASAQSDPAACRPGDLLCVEGRLGPVEGRLRIGIGEPPPPPPPVVVVPPPPPVVVMPPPPPPVVVVPPPPPPVVVAPPPPPVVVVSTPPPPPVVVAPPPPPVTVAVDARTRRTTTYELVPAFDVGLHLSLGGMFTDRIAMGGFAGAARLRPIPHIGIDLGIGAYYGQDHQLSERWEVPVTADLLIFFNPEHVFQVYALVGGGVSWASQGFTAGRRDFVSTRDLFHVGGEIGLGAEIRLSRFFALNGDIRGFLRENVAEGAPEFTEGARSTNTSAGVYGNIGMTFYFFGR